MGVIEQEEEFKKWLLLGLGLFFSVILLVALMTRLFESDSRKYTNLPENECTKTKVVTRYDLPPVSCGKACSREPIEYTYWCEKEKKFRIFVE